MEVKRNKKIPPGSIKLQFAGELILPKLSDPNLSGLFKRYQILFENFANMPRDERLLNYRLINSLMITSYAKKTEEPELKKRLFNMKNQLYIDIANDRDTRRKLGFKYLTSKNFRVIEFCSRCKKKNEAANLDAHAWKFCPNCKVDRSFYNVLSMHHRFNNGFVTVFLSNDQIHQVKGINLKNRGKLADHAEEARVERFQYNIRNLDAIDLDSAIEMYEKLNPRINVEGDLTPVQTIE